MKLDGFDPSLPCAEPFMFIECRAGVGRVDVIAYGAYGKRTAHDTTRGGVAVVDVETMQVLATLTIPMSPVARKIEFNLLSALVSENQVLSVAKRRAYYFMPWKE